MHPRGKLVAGLLGLVVLFGCSAEEPDPEPPVADLTGTSDEEPGPQDPEPTDADEAPDGLEPEADGSPEDGFAVPDEIDEPYVERVVNEIFRVEMDVSREARRTVDAGAPIPDELLDQLRSISTTEQFAFLAGGLQGHADAGFADFPEGEAGDASMEVDEIVESTSSCLVSSGTLDISESAAIEGDDALVPYFIVLVPAGEEAPNDHNPTPWLVADDGATDQPEPEVYQEICR